MYKVRNAFGCFGGGNSNADTALVWWLCFANMAGSILFMIAATAGLIVADDDYTGVNNWVCWPYTVGSVLFAVHPTAMLPLLLCAATAIQS